MPLFEMQPGELVAVRKSTFAEEKILERADLQRLLRAHIDTIADGVTIVAEEFGAFADAKRRIDLLGVDREGCLVVFELKRTIDGGHMELQALRYAAMISTMTFDDLVAHYEHYLATVEPEAVDDARARLAAGLDDGDATVISRHVRIVLVSAGFDREITTTVLWLTDLYGLDIRCVRLTPYRVGGTLLLDVQQVIPLPEASELTIQLQRRATQERALRGADGRDWTQYVITEADGESEPLRKRQAVLAMVSVLTSAGVAAKEIAKAIPSSKFLAVDGELGGQDLRDAFGRTYPKGDPLRWFMDSPFHDEGRTWMVTKMWGRDTEPVLERLAKLAPEQSGIGYEAVP
jgi:Endonuclease NucS